MGAEVTMIVDAEIATLVALYRSTVGEQWWQNDKWLTDAPVSQWYGVDVDDEGQVIEIDLSNNGLEGSIPPELAGLSKLEDLDLSYNYLQGRIPPELGLLVNLDLLGLSENALTVPSGALSLRENVE